LPAALQELAEFVVLLDQAIDELGVIRSDREQLE
jgi:hypothetical protein